MRVTSQQLEAGYQKIYRWCSFEFRQFVREAQLEVGVVMREAVKRLRDRKPLLKYVNPKRYISTIKTRISANLLGLLGRIAHVL